MKVGQIMTLQHLNETIRATQKTALVYFKLVLKSDNRADKCKFYEIGVNLRDIADQLKIDRDVYFDK